MSFSDITGKAKEVWEENVKGTYDSAVEKVKDSASTMFTDQDDLDDQNSAPVSVTHVSPDSVDVIYTDNDEGKETAVTIVDFVQMIIDHGASSVEEPVVVIYAGIIYDTEDVYVEVDTSAGLTHALSLDDIIDQLDGSPNGLEVVPGEVFDWKNANVFILAEYQL